ncbi:hypothetical protein SRHO_G00019540 [Serrasalmus rhombeus]
MNCLTRTHFLRTLLILLACCLECRGKDTVLQPRRQQWASERETVTLDCEYNTTSTNPTLLWYQQKDHHSPKYILLTNSYGTGDTAAEFRERFHSKLNSSTRTAPLMIQKLSALFLYRDLERSVVLNVEMQNLWESVYKKI